MTRAKRHFRRASEMPTVNCDNNRASMNCASNFRFTRSRHQKNTASSGGKTSSSQSKLGFSNCIFKSQVSGQPPENGLPQQNFDQQQAEPAQNKPRKQFLVLRVFADHGLGFFQFVN